METVTLSWSVKNLITINLMVWLGGGAVALGVAAFRRARNNQMAKAA